MGRTVTIKAKNDAPKRRSLSRPASILIIFMVLFGLSVLSFQAIVAVATHNTPISHTVTIHYEPVHISSGGQSEIIKQFQVRDGELFEYTPCSGDINFVFVGWSTCNSDNPLPETYFDINTPIIGDITLFAMWG